MSVRCHCIAINLLGNELINQRACGQVSNMREAVEQRVKNDTPAQRWADPKEIGEVQPGSPLLVL